MIFFSEQQSHELGYLARHVFGDEPLVLESAAGSSLVKESVAVDVCPLELFLTWEGYLGGTVQAVQRRHGLVRLHWKTEELTIFLLEMVEYTCQD